MKTIIAITCLLLAAAGSSYGISGALAAGGSEEVSRSADPRERELLEIAKNLRCPVCENQSVGDSPSGLAGQMRELIREKLKQGQTREQIEAYFTARYGEWVLLAPPKRGFNLVAWVLPFAFIASGAIVLVALLRRWRTAPAGAGDEPLGLGEDAPAEAAGARGAADPYLARLRRELEETEE